MLRKTTLILKVFLLIKNKRRSVHKCALYKLAVSLTYIYFFQNNQLLSLSGGGSFSDLVLLEILDISSNKLNKLPDDLKNLKNLKASIYIYYKYTSGEMSIWF